MSAVTWCRRFPTRYESPFPFTGTIKRILVDVSDAEFKDLATMAKVAMAMQ